jgi:hypothetical protein
VILVGSTCSFEFRLVLAYDSAVGQWRVDMMDTGYTSYQYRHTCIYSISSIVDSRYSTNQTSKNALHMSIYEYKCIQRKIVPRTPVPTRYEKTSTTKSVVQ